MCEQPPPDSPSSAPCCSERPSSATAKRLGFFSYSLTFTSLTRFWVYKEDHHQLRTLTSTWLICTPTLPDPNLGPNPNLTSPDLTLSSEG